MPRPERRSSRPHARFGRSSGAAERSDEQQTARRLAYSDDLFDQLDSDGNDSLSRDEYSAASRRAAREAVGKQRMFERLDVDDDGVLTIDEFPPSRLVRLDSDGDGIITAEELRRGRASHRHQDS
jgi:Ca2+-binding EF-hand superfamily protein